MRIIGLLICIFIGWALVFMLANFWEERDK